MNNLGLSFFDLYTLYRSRGIYRWPALKLAWQYRSFQPDHSDYFRALQHYDEQRRWADTALGDVRTGQK